MTPTTDRLSEIVPIEIGEWRSMAKNVHEIEYRDGNRLQAVSSIDMNSRDIEAGLQYLKGPDNHVYHAGLPGFTRVSFRAYRL